MARRRGKRTSQIILYVLSAIVAASMVLSLVGPLLVRTSGRPTPTWPPTWTPWPTFTSAPASTDVAEPASTATPAPAPTAIGPPAPPSPEPSATPSVAAEPIAGPPQLVVFAVAGGNRDSDERYKRLLNKIVEDGNAFLINTGDMVTDGSRNSWEAFQALMADWALPFYPVPGNQDLDDDGTLTHFVQFSGAPATHYSFDVERAHFTMANSASSRLSEEELAWIDQDLSTTEQPLKIVCTHYPPFDPDGSNDVLSAGSEAFLDLMKRHQVAYVFSGHIRAYSEAERDGTTYVISGGVGAPLQSEGHPNAFPHYVQVTIMGTEVRTAAVPFE